MRAIIFDLDGTLIDSVDLIAECWSYAFRVHGYNVLPENIYEDVGLPAETILYKYTNTADTALHEKILKITRICFENKKKHIKLVNEETLQTLNMLSKRNVLLGIATSSSCNRTLNILTELGIYNYFHTIQCLEEGIRGKPYPDLILRAIKALGIERREAMYVGDTKYDCIASNKAKVKFILLVRKWNKNLLYDNTECTIYKAIESLVELIYMLDSC